MLPWLAAHVALGPEVLPGHTGPTLPTPRPETVLKQCTRRRGQRGSEESWNLKGASTEGKLGEQLLQQQSPLFWKKEIREGEGKLGWSYHLAWSHGMDFRHHTPRSQEQCQTIEYNDHPLIESAQRRSILADHEREDVLVNPVTAQAQGLKQS